MYNVGMYGGSFNPLHMGHIKVITKAYTMCKELYIVLSVSNNPQEVDANIRYSWLHLATKHMKNVKILVMQDESYTKGEYDWNIETQNVKRIINKPIDIVFYGNDYDAVNNPFKKYYQNSEHYIFERNDCSSSKIRTNTFAYWEYLPFFVRPYFVKKILIVGTESCAKSTLTKQLALYFNTTCVQETGRDICDNAGGIDYMTNEDYYQILMNHKYIENTQLQYANKILFVDTAQIVTAYYATITNKSDADNIYKLAKTMFDTMQYDFILYLKPDVEWIQDGTRTFGDEDIRNKNDQILMDMYQNINVPILFIDGTYEERFAKAITQIEQLLDT